MPSTEQSYPLWEQLATILASEWPISLTRHLNALFLLLLVLLSNRRSSLTYLVLNLNSIPFVNLHRLRTLFWTSHTYQPHTYLHRIQHS
ncbi:hypothetical protein ACKLNR_009805 [Fusarium oxysporum f. sp. zingiberi]